MIDITIDLPSDLQRLCQANAKIYFPKRKEFATITYFAEKVKVKLDQGKASTTEEYDRDMFLEMVKTDEVVAKSRVSVPEGDTGSVRIKPRPKLVVAPIIERPKDVLPSVSELPAGTIVVQSTNTSSPSDLTTGYIDEKTGKFSRTLQKGMVEIQYRKVVQKVSLELDSVQLQKLKELGIIDE